MYEILLWLHTSSIDRSEKSNFYIAKAMMRLCKFFTWSTTAIMPFNPFSASNTFVVLLYWSMDIQSTSHFIRGHSTEPARRLSSKIEPNTRDPTRTNQSASPSWDPPPLSPSRAKRPNRAPASAASAISQTCIVAVNRLPRALWTARWRSRGAGPGGRSAGARLSSIDTERRADSGWLGTRSVSRRSVSRTQCFQVECFQV